MKSHQLFRELFQRTNAKEIAAALGLSTSMIYKWAEPVTEGGSGTPNPLDRIEQLFKVSNDPIIANWLCERAGGFFVKNTQPTTLPRTNSVVTATNAIVQEFAELLSAIAIAAGDNSISEAETRAIRSRWQELKSATEEFVHCCEQGDFGGLSARPEPKAQGR
jgi:transcriptional regulator with XRE-family HTH domain